MTASNGQPTEGNGVGLSRNRAGLSPAHVALITLLAEVAVADYLHETETADEVGRMDGEVRAR